MAQQNTLALGENSANPQVFNFDNLPVRTVDRDGAIWFVAADVCKALEISNPRDATGRLDTDEKDDVGITDTIGREQTVNIISESGLYALVMTSRKAQAKRFKKWVTAEVLPQIRKTGSYSLSKLNQSPRELTLKAARPNWPPPIMPLHLNWQHRPHKRCLRRSTGRGLTG